MNFQPTDRPAHPGEHIKREILPKGLSVKKAAELMDVGRPALSNLLNGNAALTPEMAVRIEKAFGASAEKLVALQSAYDEFQRRDQAKEIAVRTYVGPFLAIEARQIIAWSEQVRARSELPVLLRRLINSTGANLTRVDFPAYDNSQRPGWDGSVSTDTATPWIPRGLSGWELGCNRNPAQKAEEDYVARTASVPPDERKVITFVFVTPKNWIGKNEWAEEKRQKGEWKDVRAHDASDLEQWLEQSVATQAWFAEKLGSSTPGMASLEESWKEWAEVTDPSLSKILFRTAVEVHKEKLNAWLSAAPAQPFVVAADSETEALAFVACLFETLGTNPGEFYDRVLVLRSVEALKRAAAAAADFVAVVSSRDVELASGGLQKSHHTLIIRRRNDVSGEPSISLDLVDHQTFREAIVAMKIPEEECERYARETGTSPTILRRRLSRWPAIRTPAWSTDNALARKLIPLNLAGVWNSEALADREIMQQLASAEYVEIETAITELSRVADAPVWSIGKFRGVTSKIDVLFATSALVTKDELESFFFVAQYVLSESDPALDLPRDQRWAANLYGKTRDHSAVLRTSICETLVLLAVHGNSLFGERLGIDVEAHVNKIVRGLLTPLDARTWASQRRDLPHYAEAAPEVFLDVLETDLASEQPKVHELLHPAESMPFADCPRTGLLWALETLAWKPDRLVRVSSILARLSEVRITDNWTNKPQESLFAVYRCWMPQTAASIEQRNAALEFLCQRFPETGWRLCVAQFGPGTGVGHYSSRPHWRNDASGAGQPVKTMGEINRAASRALELALAWPNHNEKTLGDLVKRLQGIEEADQETVWNLIKAWVAASPVDASKQELREQIRKFAFTRRARVQGVSGATKDRAREAYELLRPADLIMRHLWLFTQAWIDESADELEDDDFDFNKHEARVGALRQAALKEIWEALGYDGIMRLCMLGNADGVIGWFLADSVIPSGQHNSFLDRLAGQANPPAAPKIDHLLSGFLGRLAPDAHNDVIMELLREFLETGTEGTDKAIRILKCSPFRSETWQRVDSLPEDLRQRYWRETYVYWDRQDENEFNTMVDRLLEVGRPRAAFSAIHINFGKIESQKLIKLLHAVATSGSEPADRFSFGQYEISEALKSLKKRADVPPATLAQLEFLYADVLDHSEYGIPTLEHELASEPRLFVQLVSLVYRRRDDGEDPAEWTIADKERRAGVATASFNVLRRASRIPGTRDGGSVDGNALLKWIEDVRAIGRDLGRMESTDYCIGELLAKSPSGSDGVWPREEVRQALDAFASQDIARGFSVGRVNLRGVHWRAKGGQQERDLALQYRGWAKAAAFQWPFTARCLEQIAQSYDHQAVWHDTDENVQKRIGY
jgi:addiction module HigA family antidote